MSLARHIRDDRGILVAVRRGPARDRIVIIAVTLLLTGFLFGLPLGGPGAVGSGALFYIIALLAPILVVGLVIAVLVSREPEYRPGAARKRGRCAACGYDLSGSPRAGDRCTVCPECGAAWRLERSAPAEEGTRE